MNFHNCRLALHGRSAGLNYGSNDVPSSDVALSIAHRFNVASILHPDDKCPQVLKLQLTGARRIIP